MFSRFCIRLIIKKKRISNLYWLAAVDKFRGVLNDTPFLPYLSTEKFKKLVDESGRKVYSNDREAHLAAIDSLRKEYGIWYEIR